jgi:hypothetical protein
MDETMTEFWKQMLVSLLRKGLFALGTVLIRQGWLTQQNVDGLLTYEVLYYLAGFILIAGTILGQYMKHRFTQKTLEKAVNSPPGTPVEVVKTEVLATESLVTRL